MRTFKQFFGEAHSGEHLRDSQLQEFVDTLTRPPYCFTMKDQDADSIQLQRPFLYAAVSDETIMTGAFLRVDPFLNVFIWNILHGGVRVQIDTPRIWSPHLSELKPTPRAPTLRLRFFSTDIHLPIVNHQLLEHLADSAPDFQTYHLYVNTPGDEADKTQAVLPRYLSRKQVLIVKQRFGLLGNEELDAEDMANLI